MTEIRQILLSEAQIARADKLCQIMTELTGIDVRVWTHNRTASDVRSMVAAVLLEEGFTEVQVGKLLNRDHSTINHYRKKMDAILNSPGYDAAREVWEKFLRRTAK